MSADRVTLRAALAVIVSTSLLAGCAPSTAIDVREPAAPEPVDCAGAASLAVESCTDRAMEGFTPSVDEARKDLSAVYDDDCRNDTETIEVQRCVFGPEDGRRVALIGDSHAAVWFPALAPIAQEPGWRLQVFYRSACSFSMAPREFDGGDPDQLGRCLAWNGELQRELAADEAHEVVITASFSGMRFLDDGGVTSRDAALRGFQQAWQPLLDRGTRVVVLAEPPLLGLERLECQLQSPTDPLPCSPTPEEARAVDDLAAVAAREAGIDVIDMSRYFCTTELCPTVLGGVLVYRDEHHFTGTYGRTLAPYLRAELDRIGALDPSAR